MGPQYPTKRDVDAMHTAGGRVEVPDELTTLPWIDVHNHAHTLSWGDREKYPLSGCRAMVMMAATYYWTPYYPVHGDDIRYLWDDALNRLAQIRKSHFVDARLGIGIHTGKKVVGCDDLLRTMAEYCQLEEVVAIGETGITAKQHVEPWRLEEQEPVVQSQMELAAEYELPIVLHTPSNSSGERTVDSFPEYEVDLTLKKIDSFDAANAKMEAANVDLRLAEAAGLPEEQLVFSHADETLTSYLMEHTDAYASYTIGRASSSSVSVQEIADTIDRYGPERILLETDSAGILKGDVFEFKRTIFELYRQGVDVDTIETVVYENPRRVVGLGGE